MVVKIYRNQIPWREEFSGRLFHDKSVIRNEPNHIQNCYSQSIVYFISFYRRSIFSIILLSQYLSMIRNFENPDPITVNPKLHHINLNSSLIYLYSSISFNFLVDPSITFFNLASFLSSPTSHFVQKTVFFLTVCRRRSKKKLGRDSTLAVISFTN